MYVVDKNVCFMFVCNIIILNKKSSDLVMEKESGLILGIVLILNHNINLKIIPSFF